MVFVPARHDRQSSVPAKHIVTSYKTTIKLEGHDGAKFRVA